MKQFITECSNVALLHRRKGALYNFHRRHPELDALSILGERTSTIESGEYLYHLFKRVAVPCSLRGIIALGRTYSSRDLCTLSESMMERAVINDRPSWLGRDVVVHLEGKQFTHCLPDDQYIDTLRLAGRDDHLRICSRMGYPKGNNTHDCLYSFLLSISDPKLAQVVKELAILPTYNKHRFLTLIMEKMR